MEKQQSIQNMKRHLYAFLLTSAIVTVGFSVALEPSQSLDIIHYLWMLLFFVHSVFGAVAIVELVVYINVVLDGLE